MYRTAAQSTYYVPGMVLHDARPPSVHILWKLLSAGVCLCPYVPSINSLPVRPFTTLYLYSFCVQRSFVGSLICCSHMIYIFMSRLQSTGALLTVDSGDLSAHFLCMIHLHWILNLYFHYESHCCTLLIVVHSAQWLQSRAATLRNRYQYVTIILPPGATQR